MRDLLILNVAAFDSLLPAGDLPGEDDRTHERGITVPTSNPIELCFAKLKTIVRAARCRSTETLWPLLGECLQRFSSAECRNYFRHCGYLGAKRSCKPLFRDPIDRADALFVRRRDATCR